ncbi:MAG: hypothetical protein WC986_14125 [Elusimicrobiota bacterium]
MRAVQGGSAVYASQWTASGAGMKLGSSYPKEASSESGIAVHLGFSKSMSPLEEVSLDGVAASTVYTVDPSSRDWRAIFSSTAVSGFGKSAPLRLTVRGKDLAGNSLLRTAEDRSLPDMSALSSAITANGGADEVHRLHPPYYLTATPLIQPIPIFRSASYAVSVTNRWLPPEAVFILNATLRAGRYWISNVATLDTKTFQLAPGGGQSFQFLLENDGAQDSAQANFRVRAQGAGEQSWVTDIATIGNAAGVAGFYPTHSGGDHPDDNYSVASPSYPTPWLVDTLADVGILMKGWAVGTGHLLGKYGIQTAPIGEDFTGLDEAGHKLEDLRVLVVGSNGLGGMNSQIWRERLKAFVSNGGALVSFTQSFGTDFAALPSSMTIEGYGDREDISCFAMSAAIADASPVFAGQYNAVLNANMDGYITKYPDNAKVLLRRRINGMPALIEYPYGKGKVITGGMFSDYGYGTSQMADDEKRLARDIVRYAAASGVIAEFPMGAQAQIDATVRYASAAAAGAAGCGGDFGGANEAPCATALTATRAVLRVYNPDGNLLKTQNVALSILPGQSATIPVSVLAESAGIYWVTYTLENSDGIVVQAEAQESAFTAKTNITVNGYSPGTLQMRATLPADKMGTGMPMTFTVNIKNNGTTDFTGNLYGDFMRSGKVLAQSSVTIPAGDTAILPYTYTDEHNSFGTLRMFFYLTPANAGPDAVVADADKSWVAVSPGEIAVSAGEEEYIRGGTVTTKVFLKNSLGTSFDGTLSVDRVSPTGESLRVWESSVQLNAMQSSTQTFTFTLPLDAALGRWLTLARLSTGQGRILASTGFSVKSSRLVLNPQWPERLRAGMDTVPVVLSVREVVGVSSGTLSAQLIAPDGSIVWQAEQAFGEIAPGASVRLDFVPSGFVAGEGAYTLACEALYDGNATVLKLPVRAQVAAEASFDKTAYRVRDALGMTLKVADAGSLAVTGVSVTVSIPETGFSESGWVDLASGSGTLTFAAVLPPGLSPGPHQVHVAMPFMTAPEELFDFIVLSPAFDMSVETPQAAPGGTVRIKLKNTGGVDASCAGYLKLTDARGKTVYDSYHQTGSLPAGTGEEEFSFTLPDDIAAGGYTAFLDGWDNVTWQSLQKWGKLTVTPNSALAVSISADKDAYHPAETVTATGTAQAPMDSTLELKAYGAAPGWKGYSAVGVANAVYDDGENVWFATADGVKRYEKAANAWRVYRSSETNGALANADVIAISGTGSEIWFLHRTHAPAGGEDSTGLAVFDRSAGTWSSFPGPEGVKLAAIGADAQDVWAAGKLGDLYRYPRPAGPWQRVLEPVPAGDGNGLVKPLLVDEQGVWLGRSMQTEWSGELLHYDKASGATDRTIEVSPFQSFAASAQNLFVVGIYGEVLRYDRASSAQLPSLGNPCGWNCKTQALYWDGMSLWMGTPWDGAVAWNSETGAVSWYGRSEGLLSDDVRAIGGSGGVLWFGHGIGASRYEPASVWTQFAQAGIGGSAVHDIFAGDDQVAAGHELHGGYGLSALDRRTGLWKQGYSAGDVGTVQVLDGNVWYAAYVGGAGLLCGEDADCPYLEPGPPMGPGTDLHADFSMRATGSLSMMSSVGGGSYKASGALADGPYVWYINPGGSDSYSQYAPSLWLYDPEAGEWRGRVQGDEEEWEPWAFWSSAPLVRMADDGDGLWAAVRQTRQGYTDPGIGRFDKAKGTWTLYGIAEGLPSADVNDVAVDGDIVWAATDRGAARWERATGHWSVFASTLPGTRVNAVLADQDAVWFGTEKGLSRWNKASGNWVHYTTAEGLANERVLSLASDDSFLWVGTAGGLSRLTLRAGQDVVWSKDLGLSGGMQAFSETVSGVSVPGKYRLEAGIRNQFGQKLSQARNSFYVAPGSIVLSFNAEKESYKPGETVRISGLLRNIGAIPEDGTLSLEKDGSALLSENVHLEPGEAKPFSVETEAERSFDLAGKFQDLKVLDSVKVVSPKISLRLLGPDSAGVKPFSMTALAANEGDSDAELSLDFAGEHSTFSLAAGETMIMQGEFSIAASTEIAAVLGGDVSRVVKKPVCMAASGWLNVEPDFTYPEGAASVRYYMENNGEVPWDLEVRFFVDGATITRRHSVLAWNGFSATLVLANMTEGEHVLRYESALFSGTALISVSKYGALRIDEFTVDEQSLTPEGKVHASGRVTNPGQYAFEGELRIESQLWSLGEQIALAPGEERMLSWDLPAGAAAGDYEAFLQVYAGGNFVSERSAEFRLEPYWSVESSNIAASYPAGGTQAMSFTIRNSGSGEGTTKVRVSAGDILGQEQSAWLKVGEAKEFSFDVLLPEDLESKQYNGALSVTSPQSMRRLEQPFVLNVEGFALEASAAFDKPVYDAGEVAHLSLSARSANARTPAIFMKVNGTGYESVASTFTVGPVVETRSFDIPVPSSGGPSYMISWGVYLSSGRAIKLDTLYLNRCMDGLSVVLDKPRYGMGENVSASVTVESTGTLVLSAPGWTETIPVESTGTLIRGFSLPGEMLSGTSYIHASLDGQGADWPLDVDGYTIHLVSMKADKALYVAGEDFRAELQVDSNRAASGVLLSGGVRDQAADGPASFQTWIDIPQGLSAWTVQGKIPADLAGTAAVDARLGKSLSAGMVTLAAAGVSFDVRKIGELAPHISLRLSSTAQGAMVKPPVPFVLEGVGLDGLLKVEFLLDSSTIPAAVLAGGAASYAWTWDAASASQGAHAVQAAGYDSSGRGLSNRVDFVLDTMPPETILLVNGLEVSATSLSLLPADVLSFISTDALSGVADILYFLDGGPEQVYSSTFTLPAGTLQLAFHSKDHAGNVEPQRIVPVAVASPDITPPQTALLVNGLAVSATSIVLISTDSLGFSATDAESGVQETRYSVDGATETVFVSTFSLIAGTHTLAFHSLDSAGNIELSRSAEIDVLLYDVDAPSLALSPVNGSTVTLSAPLITAAYSDAGRGIDPGSVRLLLDAVDMTAQSVVSASSVSFVPAVPLSQGTHAVSAEVADLAGNRATASSRFFTDSLAPLTSLLVNGTAVSADSAVIVSTDVLGFAAVDAGVGLAETRYSLDGSTNEVVFTSTFSLPSGNHSLVFHSLDRVGNAEPAKGILLTILSYDVTPPALALLPVNGSTIIVNRPAIDAAYSDSGRGMDLASVRLSLDDVDVSAQSSVWTSSAVYVPATDLSQGTHTAIAVAADLAGNRSSVSTSFLVDSLPPVTTLLMNGLQSSATTLVLVSTDTLGFTASDSGVGVQETRYRLDGAAETVFSTAFSLATGTHTLAFYSLDRAGNTEGQRAIGITVLSPPTPSGLLVRLDYPWPGALEVEQAVGGKVDVRAALQGGGLRTWKLSVAPGVAANTGFTTLASGTAPVTGRIATWDATRLSGRYTMKLEATDSVGATSLSTAAVYIGNPEAVFTVGSRGSDEFVSLLKDPEGLVVRPDGNIWVGVDGTDKLLLISPEGQLLASVGSHGRGPLKFQNPRGMSLDAGGNLYVADRGNDRVAKLSPDGSQLLKEFDSDLQGPNDAVVDADGSVYVADTGHGRVRVFAPGGTVLRDISLGRHSRPWGVALTSAGLWVSDRQDRTVRLYSRGGTLLKTTNDMGRVRGAAVDRGRALYVADRTMDRIDKYDPDGKQLLSIGPRNRATEWERCWMRYLSDPADAAIGPDGALWVADSGHNRLVKYVLPTGNAHEKPHGHRMSATAQGGEGSASGPVFSNDPVSRTVSVEDGGKVERDDGTSVRVPPAALSSPLEITVSAPDAAQDSESKEGKRRAKRLAAVSSEVEYGPTGTTFEKPVTITLAYDHARITSLGMKEETLKVHYWNPDTKDWEALDSVVDPDAGTVSAQTDHFSVYQVLGAGGTGIGVAAADASFGVKAHYVFPNPVRGVNAVTFRMQPGLADSLEIHVYDLAGRKVHSSSDFMDRGAFDDGNGGGARYTYDHVWDVSGVGSGVYVYVITARKAGQPDVRASGRVGVIK